MGKVIEKKIVITNDPGKDTIIIDAPPMVTSKKPTDPPEPSHLNEEQVLVFDEYGNVVGHVSHEKSKELC